MMNPPLYFRYLFTLYLKYYLIFLLGLSIAFALIDYLQHLGELPSGTNRQLLYLFYRWQEALLVLNAIGMLFALIALWVKLVKEHQLVAMLSLSIDKKRIFLPFLLVMVLALFLFVVLQNSDFIYAKQRAKALLGKEATEQRTDELFFKYNDQFVFAKRLIPGRYRLEEVTIFYVKGKRVGSVINAPYALFNNNRWIAYDVTKKEHRYNLSGELTGYRILHFKTYETLEGYLPKIIESFNTQGGELRLSDALLMWRLYKKEGIGTAKVRAYLYEKVILPLFAPILSFVLFVSMPVHRRMVSLSVVVTYALVGSLAVLGVLFALKELAKSGTLSPEISILLPIALLFFVSIFLAIKKET